jgi:hypothetical protein
MIGPFQFERANNTVTNLYLRGPDRQPSNISSYRLDRDARIIGIAAGGRIGVSQTWTAEVRRNGVTTPLASLAISAADGAEGAFSVDVDQGDVIQGYMNGTSIDRPSMTVYLEER